MTDDELRAIIGESEGSIQTDIVNYLESLDYIVIRHNAGHVKHNVKLSPDFTPDLIWNGLVSDPQGGVSRLARLIYDAEIVMGIHQQGKLSNWFAKALDNNFDRCKKISNFLT